MRAVGRLAGALVLSALVTIPSAAQTPPADPAPAPEAPPAAPSTPDVPAAPEAAAAPVASPPTPPSTDPVVRPFGAGQPINVQCDEPDGYVYVAKGVADDQPQFPDPFTKIGRIPVQLELPPGVYTVLVEGESFTSQSTVFEVRHQPVDVRVHAGSSELRALSTLLLALGGAALIAGGVIEVSGTGEGDSSKKHKITIPLFIGGGVGFAGGLGMYFASASSIEHNGFVPPEQGQQASPAPRVYGLGLSGRF